VEATVAVRNIIRPWLAVAPTWTGFYVGGNVGSGWGQNDTTLFAPPLLLNAGAIPLASQGERGLLGGIQAGYNYQWGPIVLGIEGIADWMNLKGTTQCTILGASFACAATIQRIEDLGARIGFAVDKSLLYVRSGAAWAETNFTMSAGSANTSPLSVSTPIPRFGAFLGAGIEYAFLPNWSAKLEYDFYDFGSKTSSIPFSFVFVGIPINTAGSLNSDLTAQTIKFGVNYRFNPWGL